MNEQEAELQNPFPSPPSNYTNYATSSIGPQSLDRQDKPRVDLILQEGHYNVFGDTWFVKETIPTLAELGGHQLYPADPGFDRRPALLAILRSFLVSYSTLTSSLLVPPASLSSTAPAEWQQHVDWVTILSQNILAAANDLRPVQARGHLEHIMKQQLDLRRGETNAINLKCDSLETQLTCLRGSAKEVHTESIFKNADLPTTRHERSENALYPARLLNVTFDNMLHWAEEL
ncbi:hypothetical protein SERLA73DRAFT_182601 [Serpula lacrymans var. lacrymans S7.3]|uniref:Mediator of RNA polymerase II transcription subunit 7 n=2 Tax=Serpula lacrymans var. lacrymans TaxID=341189 RepID=F8Q0L5_SERL3|nr:uncharacterized protein SERLADRAFT_469332 [Serpula lacrymans var. lacrymans S7.9]EGN97844.1 hypothetical protein SERLA73DRAFT_182601 [Serpula lacrymans var. lacrymans S7.3]EGO23430.1 hypothetical protein SERLADRAFT_469332 [Serpula lacrymans var. lacrymans S7.9]